MGTVRIRVGIPRGLLYYEYYPMWKAFFEELGAEVVVSPPTTQSILSAGSSRVVADTCLPVKVFVGHVLALVGKCDYIFIPALRSVSAKIHNCPKFLGLPDVTRATVPESPPILDVNIDVNKGKGDLYQAIYEAARPFTRSHSRAGQAAMVAWQAHLNYRQMMCQHKLTLPQAIDEISGTSETRRKSTLAQPSAQATIAVIGHPYVLYDELINHRLVHRLVQAHNEVLTPEMISDEESESAIEGAVGKTYWTYEGEVVGAGEHYLNNSVDGVIGVVAFGCGPDSLMMDVVRRRARLTTTPFMLLTLDEHTAEAGMVTRLEAFLDMIQRKKRQLCVSA
jgi:predicted nucleotide-binding protein (sugar kinase/HSP70/actin superfamily)